MPPFPDGLKILTEKLIVVILPDCILALMGVLYESFQIAIKLKSNYCDKLEGTALGSKEVLGLTKRGETYSQTKAGLASFLYGSKNVVKVLFPIGKDSLH